MKNSDRIYMFIFGAVIALAIQYMICISWFIPDSFWMEYNLSTLPSEVVRHYVFIPHGQIILLISALCGIIFTYIIEKLDEAGY